MTSDTASRATVEIRPICPADSIEALTGLLHRAYAGLAAMGLNYTAVDQSPAVTAKRNELGDCFIALDGTTPVGTILVNRTVPNFLGERLGRPLIASLHQFAVAPECQGQGLGSLLLRRAEDWARDCGFAEIALDTAEPARHLLAFYGRRGYNQVGTVQWDAKSYPSIIMSKALEAPS